MPSRRRAARRKKPRRTQVQRDGGLAVTFVNSASGRQRHPESYADFLTFARRHCKSRARALEALESFAEEHPEEAAAVLEEVHEVLDVLSRIFNALADRQKPPKDAVQALNAYFLGPFPSRYLRGTDDYFQWAWMNPSTPDLRRPLWWVLWSAGEILTTPRYCRSLNRCAAEGCNGLFVVRNPGKPRKWCRPSCGSRVTSRKHYDKKVRPRRKKAKKLNEAADKNLHDTLIYQDKEIQRLKKELQTLQNDQVGTDSDE